MGFGKDDREEANRIAAEELAFSKELHNRHLAIFGDIEESLSEYYKNLSGETYANKTAGIFQQQFQKAKENVTKELARRGLNGSNLYLFMSQNMDLQGAQHKAQIYAGADEYVAGKKQAFVRGGDNVRGQNMNFRSNAANTAVNQYMSSANMQWSQFKDLVSMTTGIGQKNDYQSIKSNFPS